MIFSHWDYGDKIRISIFDRRVESGAAWGGRGNDGMDGVPEESRENHRGMPAIPIANRGAGKARARITVGELGSLPCEY